MDGWMGSFSRFNLHLIKFPFGLQTHSLCCSNLLYNRNLQRPDAICHFPRDLVRYQVALLQHTKSKPTTNGLTLAVLHKLSDRKWGQVEVFVFILLLFWMVRLGGCYYRYREKKKANPVTSHYSCFQKDICNIIGLNVRAEEGEHNYDLLFNGLTCWLHC